ncbi:hypothetical protein SCHPADRAFT_894700 [Schizopora paradoxa]|uniref:Blue (type 1) copper domain-containing protein n=1 Tax=Schizopora paradoxa TaxID=27342 RepID=A0A0H2RRC3_9AGAM|nr:hypothetical protein SCHPADRAFT_894700 [Schizopora paradoxa]
MQFALSVLALSAVASAQIYGPPPGPASPASSSSSAAAPAVPTAPPDTPGFMNIDVAFQETFTFHPNNITAPNGTVVTFYFPANGLSHSVTQSSFADPCTFLAANTTAGTPNGFDSDLQQGVQFSITIVNESQPIWFHCKQLLHCGMGMVGAINAPTTGNNTFTNFMANAMAIGSSETTEPTGTVFTGGVGAIATASPSDTATAAAGSGSSSSGSSSSTSNPSQVPTSGSSTPSTSSSSAGATRLTATSGALGLLIAAASMLVFA